MKDRGADGIAKPFGVLAGFRGGYNSDIPAILCRALDVERRGCAAGAGTQYEICTVFRNSRCVSLHGVFRNIGEETQ